MICIWWNWILDLGFSWILWGKHCKYTKRLLTSNPKFLWLVGDIMQIFVCLCEWVCLCLCQIWYHSSPWHALHYTALLISLEPAAVWNQAKYSESWSEKGGGGGGQRGRGEIPKGSLMLESRWSDMMHPCLYTHTNAHADADTLTGTRTSIVPDTVLIYPFTE